MSDPASALSAAIGAKVKRERKSRHWTLDRLAEAAGVSRRMIVNVESGTANPSVSTLLRISDALGVGLPALVEQPAGSGVQVTRSGEGSPLWQGDHGGRGVLVAGTHSPDVLELWDWTLGEGDVHVSEEHAAGTKELLQVQAGTVEVTVSGESLVLGAGDAIGFAGEFPHSYCNAGLGTARFVLAVFEPDVGSR